MSKKKNNNKIEVEMKDTLQINETDVMIDKLNSLKLKHSDEDYLDLIKYLRSKGQIPMSYTSNILKLENILKVK